jgi:hypothetical protein
MLMWPASTASSPAIMRRVVVLPQPEGPSSARNAPLCSSSEMPFTTFVAPYAL